ncbi:heat-shock protein HslJ [Photobacterium sp. GB-27]|uniref:META domain-containing protein n=1 Tax=Photobacterium sp. GB-27 TaxID=2022109 RepID=UPI000D169198|nr:META domain-containing protein [Photobacterium sp. GB-27]PSV38392.1 heat-shock protein HslJ [Photobacterium sp. GB-27]
MKKILLSTLLLTSLLTGCSSSPKDAAALPSTWAVMAIDGHSEPVDALPKKPELVIDKNLTVTYHGCNTLKGTLTLTGQNLLTKNLASTRKMCIQNEQAIVDGFVKRMLTGPSDYLVNQNTLIISSERHTVTFKKVK